jgi:hypothetical protein
MGSGSSIYPARGTPLNPYVVEATRDAIRLFASFASAGDFEKAEDLAITAFGLAAIWPNSREADRATDEVVDA